MKLASRCWTLAGLLIAAATGSADAGGGGDDAGGRVVFARGGSLWLTDSRGKGKPVELAVLAARPGAADEVRAIRSDADGDTIIVDVGGRWYWAALPATGDGSGAPATLAELPCGAGPARLSARGECVLCASPTGTARLVRLADGKTFDRGAPAAAASLVDRGEHRELVWVDGDAGGVVAAALARPAETRVLAPAAPVRGFLAAPDGSRGVGVFRARPARPAGAPERDELFGFALDGTAARRRLIRDGIVLDWSWDSRWLLIQDGSKACLARATGGQFKCWKGYTAVSLSPDGAWALVLGPRGADGVGSGATAEPRETGAGGEGEAGGGEGGGEGDAGGGSDGGHDAPGEVAVALPKGPLSLYRAKLAGPYTERPALVETVVDGAALWLPAAPSPSPSPKPSPSPSPSPSPTSASTPQP